MLPMWASGAAAGGLGSTVDALVFAVAVLVFAVGTFRTGAIGR